MQFQVLLLLVQFLQLVRKALIYQKYLDLLRKKSINLVLVAQDLKNENLSPYLEPIIGNLSDIEFKSS